MSPRRLLVFVVVAPAAALVVYAAGLAWTAVTLDDGLDRLPVDLRGRAAQALDSAHVGCNENPLLRLWIRKLRLETFEPTPDRCPLDEATSNFRAVVQAYGPFGLPLRTFRGDCQSWMCTDMPEGTSGAR
jgi:hypothetical protein